MIDYRKALSPRSSCVYLILTLTAWLTLAGLAPAAAQQPTPVFVEKAKRDRFVDTVEALGTLRANETVALTATVTDTITAIHFDDGQQVQAGKVLVEMTSEEEHALLEEARSLSAEAERQYQRVIPLAKDKTAPQSLLDERRRQDETAKARLRAIESRMRDRLIIAPFTGVVGLRNISVGALVEPGDLITTLDDISVMKLDFAVPTTYLEALEPGLPIIAKSHAFGERRFEGTIASIDSRIDPVTRSITARALLPNPDGILKPGLLMTIELLKNPREAVVVAEEALIPQGQNNYVLIVDQSGEQPVAERRQVTIGARRPGQVEILTGVDAGELVITHGTLKVRPGQPVTIRAIEQDDETLEQLLSQHNPRNRS